MYVYYLDDTVAAPSLDPPEVADSPRPTKVKSSLDLQEGVIKKRSKTMMRMRERQRERERERKRERERETKRAREKEREGGVVKEYMYDSVKM